MTELSTHDLASMVSIMPQALTEEIFGPYLCYALGAEYRQMARQHLLKMSMLKVIEEPDGDFEGLMTINISPFRGLYADYSPDGQHLAFGGEFIVYAFRSEAVASEVANFMAQRWETQRHPLYADHLVAVRLPLRIVPFYYWFLQGFYTYFIPCVRRFSLETYEPERVLSLIEKKSQEKIRFIIEQRYQVSPPVDQELTLPPPFDFDEILTSPDKDGLIAPWQMTLLREKAKQLAHIMEKNGLPKAPPDPKEAWRTCGQQPERPHRQ